MPVSALIKAASRGESPDFIKFLIENEGSDVNERGDNGMSPLIYAAYFAHDDVVRTLLDSGADVNACGNNGITALMAALQNPAGEMIARLLIANGANVNASDGQGLTPLMTAVYTENIEMTSFILEKGADVNFKSSQGWTALDLAKQKEHRQLIQLLHQAGCFKNADLIYAARIGDADWVAALIDAGADVNEKNEDQETPLLWASFNGHLKVVRYLLDNGARVDERNKEGWSALMAAVLGERLETARVLLSRGADPNAAVREGVTAAMTPPGDGEESPNCDKNEGVNSRYIGKTPLMAAAETGNERLVKLLLKRGAEINLKTESGDTALTFAEKNGYSNIIGIIKNYRAKTGERQ